jgi:flavin-dependent dehydrogenase
MAKKYKFDIIIIGGGASGMIAAISARRLGAEVLILERNSRIGKKFWRREMDAVIILILIRISNILTVKTLSSYIVLLMNLMFRIQFNSLRNWG